MPPSVPPPGDGSVPRRPEPLQRRRDDRTIVIHSHGQLVLVVGEGELVVQQHRTAGDWHGTAGATNVRIVQPAKEPVNHPRR